MSKAVESLKKVLANTYVLLLKTQNYHWHIHGSQFAALHVLFETQYNELFMAVDTIAERILALGEQAPATFSAFEKLNELPESVSQTNATEMLKDLEQSHQKLIELLKQLAKDAQGDLVTEGLAVERLGVHEKTLWMLTASRS